MSENSKTQGEVTTEDVVEEVEDTTPEPEAKSDDGKSTYKGRQAYKERFEAAQSQLEESNAELARLKSEEKARNEAKMIEEGRLSEVVEELKGQIAEKEALISEKDQVVSVANRQSSFVVEAIKQGMNPDAIDDAFAVVQWEDGQSTADVVSGLLESKPFFKSVSDKIPQIDGSSQRKANLENKETTDDRRRRLTGAGNTGIFGDDLTGQGGGVFFPQQHLAGND